MKIARSRFVGLFSTILLFVSTHASALTVGIDGNAVGTHDELLWTLQTLGHTVVEDGSTAIDVFINAAGSTSSYDLNDSVNLGIGFIQIGNWNPTWTPSSHHYDPVGPYNLQIDNSHAITAGLDATWSEMGFHNNNSDWNPTDLPKGYLGWDADASHQSIISSTSVYSHTRVVTAEDLGSYRAVYIGIEAFGHRCRRQ